MANFSRDGYFNSRNCHYYNQENPHRKWEFNHQNRFSVNVWVGIIKNWVIGSIILPRRLNRDQFLNILENEISNEINNLPLATLRNMWIQLDGAPPHFAAPVRNWLNEQYPNRWIGRNGPVSWPPRSPDLTPLDFFLWSHVKALVYQTPVHNEEELILRIRNALTTVTPEMLTQVQVSTRRRLELCLENQGHQFEQFL